MDLIQNIHIQKITEILKQIGERVEGNLICDIDPDNWVIHRNMSKIKNIQHLCKDKNKIIEIGVNACHSLIIMLLVNPTAEYLLFDLNNHRYTEPILEYVRNAFPHTKITTVFGNSVETIPIYLHSHNNEWYSYDLCHLDGGHTEDIFSHDYMNVYTFMKKDTCILFDDYDLPAISRFIQKKEKDGEIEEWKENGIHATHYHFPYKYCSSPKN